jgi:hypothetical protein
LYAALVGAPCLLHATARSAANPSAANFLTRTHRQRRGEVYGSPIAQKRPARVPT